MISYTFEGRINRVIIRFVNFKAVCPFNSFFNGDVLRSPVRGGACALDGGGRRTTIDRDPHREALRTRCAYSPKDHRLKWRNKMTSVKNNRGHGDRRLNPDIKTQIAA